MCVACAMTAAAGASGARSWLQTRDWSWVTPRVLRRATVALVVAAFGVSTVGISGSATAAHAPGPAATR